VDWSALAKLVAYGKAHSFDSLLIARHGRIVLDAYHEPYTAEIPHIANSVTKVVTGTLIAIALKEGLDLGGGICPNTSFSCTAMPTTMTRAPGGHISAD
jgi:hypothetical protein